MGPQQQAQQPQSIDLSAGLQPQQPQGGGIDLSAGLQPQAQSPDFTAVGVATGVGKEALDIGKGMLTTVAPGQQGVIAGLEALPATYRAYETARQQGKGIWDAVSAANDEAKKYNDAQNIVKTRYREFLEHPDEATGRLLTDAIAVIAGAKMGAGAPAAEGAEEGAAEGAAEGATKPGLVKQVIKGKDVTQPEIQQAMRNVGQSVKVQSAPVKAAGAPIEDTPRPSVETPQSANELISSESPKPSVEPTAKTVPSPEVKASPTGPPKGLSPDIDPIRYTSKDGSIDLDRYRQIRFNDLYKQKLDEYGMPTVAGGIARDIIKDEIEAFSAQAPQAKSPMAATLTPRPAETPVEPTPQIPRPQADSMNLNANDSPAKPVGKVEKTPPPPRYEAGTLRSVDNTAQTSLRESLTKPIDAARQAKESLYKAYDEAAGVDRKALQERLDNTQDQMSKLTGTAVDMRRLTRLQEAESALKDEIAQADSKAEAAGMKISDADAANVKLRALEDVERNVFKNQEVVKGNAAQGEKEYVDVDNAIKAIQKMKDNEKFGGPRWDQAFEVGSGDRILRQLREYRATGQSALAKQTFAKWLGGALGVGAAAKAIGLGKDLLQ